MKTRTLWYLGGSVAGASIFIAAHYGWPAIVLALCFTPFGAGIAAAIGTDARA